MSGPLLRDWVDASGTPPRAPPAVIAAIEARLDTRAPDSPFLSADAGRPIPLPPGGHGPVELLFEDGARSTPTVDHDGTIPATDRIGYHQLIVGDRAYMLAVAPRRCPEVPRHAWGVSLQIPALRGTPAAPFGDAGTLAETAAAFGHAGAQAIAISPTHALFPGALHRISPYSPSTRLFRNVLLADPTLIGVPVPPACGDELIDWPAAGARRLEALRSAYALAGDAAKAAAQAWRRQRGAELEAHARFDALHARFGGEGWRDWPLPYQDAGGEAVIRFAAEAEGDIAFFAFLQWLTDLSLATAQRAARDRMRIGLIADLAVGMTGDGSHAWSAPDDLLAGLTIGAPPDSLGPDGQNWGITALDPFALERSAFRPFIATLRAAFAHAGGLRIDHALGLDRLWVIPEGAEATQGAYLTMPADHLKRIVAIEAHRAQAIVIAEDLGTVPPGLRDGLAARCMLGMRVLPFERDADGAFVPPRDWDAQAVAMTGTHDTPTVVGWWRGRDLDWRERLGGRPDRIARERDKAGLWTMLGEDGPPPADAPLDTILSAVAEAPAPLAIVPVEDLLGLEEQPNLPGTVDTHPNWRRRLPGETGALLARRAVARRTQMLTARRPG
jgi:4-alpha-glucanotransferase